MASSVLTLVARGQVLHRGLLVQRELFGFLAAAAFCADLVAVLIEHEVVRERDPDREHLRDHFQRCLSAAVAEVRVGRGDTHQHHEAGEYAGAIVTGRAALDRKIRLEEVTRALVSLAIEPAHARLRSEKTSTAPRAEVERTCGR